MAINTRTDATIYAGLMDHVGHNIVVVTYGLPDEDAVNVALECEDCGTVLLTADAPDGDE